LALADLDRIQQPIEADDPVEAELLVGPGEERVGPAEAETKADDRGRSGSLGEGGARRREVELDRLGSGLRYLGGEVEVLATLLGARCAAEVVEGDRVVAGFGEALDQLDVEAVEAPDVG